MNIEEMQKEENFEHEVLDRLKCLDPSDFDYNAVDGSYVDAVLKARDVILTAYEKEKEKNKEYKNLLIDMVNQFAYEDNNPKTRGSSEQKIYTAGLSTLEDTFYLLDIDEGIKREDLWKLKEE